jgi:hypothetical protein
VNISQLKLRSEKFDDDDDDDNNNVDNSSLLIILFPKLVFLNHVRVFPYNKPNQMH